MLHIKNLSFPINEFVNYFHLIGSDGLMCFDATVQYKIEGEIKQFETQVQIVTIEPKRLDTVYILGDEINDLELPDTFHDNKQAIIYIENRCLLIVGNTGPLGDYEVFIYPKLSNKRSAK